MSFRGYTSEFRRLDNILIRKIYKPQWIWQKDREAEFLKILSKYNRYPKLSNIGTNYIDMTYEGTHVTNFKKYANQASSIIEPLLIEGITHRDITYRNVLINEDGDIRLIDFGFSLFRGELESPIPAPKCLGGKNYKPDSEKGIWNDVRAVELLFSE
jgi:serine/threonine protein kinase